MAEKVLIVVIGMGTSAKVLVPPFRRTLLRGRPVGARREAARRIGVDGAFVFPQQMQLVACGQVPVGKAAIGQILAEFKGRERRGICNLPVIDPPVFGRIRRNIVGACRRLPLAACALVIVCNKERFACVRGGIEHEPGKERVVGSATVAVVAHVANIRAKRRRGTAGAVFAVSCFPVIAIAILKDMMIAVVDYVPFIAGWIAATASAR